MLERETDPAEIGSRVRVIRRRRGLSLHVVAGLAGISAPYLSMLETGRRRFERRGLLEDLAGALGCSVSDLTGQPYLPTHGDSADALATVPGIRLALNSYGPDDMPEVQPRAAGRLAAWADAVNERCTQADYASAGRDLDILLAESQAHAFTGSRADRRAAVAAAVTACFAAGVVASRTGHMDMSVTAARHGYELACRHGDPGLLGFARWYWAIELTTLGARSRARSVLTTSVDDLLPRAETRTEDTLTAEMLGHSHLQLARAAARENKVDESRSHLDEAHRLATRVGERNGMRQHFGPTNVAAWRLATGIELGEGGRAYDELTRAGVDANVLGSNERASSLHFDMSRALVQDGTERDADAIRHLDKADRLAPQRVRPDPIARELIGTLASRARRRVWELDSLRNRFGMG